jgi:hypothetical protein
MELYRFMRFQAQTRKTRDTHTPHVGHPFDAWFKCTKNSRPLLRIDGEAHTNRWRHLAAVLADARAHGARPRRHRDLAAEVIPFHRHGVHAAREGVLLLLDADPQHTLRWRLREGVAGCGRGPREQRVYAACDVRARATALGAVVGEQ